jgi:LPS sulfotransferase NodH
MSKFISIEPIEEKYVREDFIDKRFDTVSTLPLQKIILLFSTPRSGSTYLCDQIYRGTGLVGHEYFQPYGYIQVLAKRWGCCIDGKINPEKYIQSLIRHRSRWGNLIINLHGSHLSFFKQFEGFLETVSTNAYHLNRLDILGQSISYALALKDGQWSSFFPNKNPEASVCLAEAFKASKDITWQNMQINSYCRLRGIMPKPLMYEEIVQAGALDAIINDVKNDIAMDEHDVIRAAQQINNSAGVRKQSSEKKKAISLALSQEIMG